MYYRLYKVDFVPFKLGTGVESGLCTQAKSQNEAEPKLPCHPVRPSRQKTWRGRQEQKNMNLRLMLELRDVSIPGARIKVKPHKTTVQVRKRFQAD